MKKYIIKKLKWIKANNHWEAYTPFGTYEIYEHSGMCEWYWEPGNDDLRENGYSTSFEECKEDVWKHYVKFLEEGLEPILEPV